jgi:hypothetical protein
VYRGASFKPNKESTVDTFTITACALGVVALALQARWLLRTAKDIKDMTPKELAMHDELTMI